MLVLTGKEGESLTIFQSANIDHATPIGEDFTTPIRITLNKVTDQAVIGVEAPDVITVICEELIKYPQLITY